MLKWGKTADGAVWLRDDMLSAYDYWQFWRNTEDGDVGLFLKMFTELPLSEISRLEKLQGQEINEAKIILANEATALCHGKEAAESAYNTSVKTFSEGNSDNNLPSFEIKSADLHNGITAYKLFALSGICESGGAAKRLIKGGGGKVNNTPITDENTVISLNDFVNKQIKISAGKKKHLLIKIV